MLNLFFSYAHQDEQRRDELETHLAVLKRSGLIRAWHDRRISAGSELDHTICESLEQADVVLLLLSPHFLASDYCYEREAMRALERHHAGEAVVIPVILEPCDWLYSPFRALRATPPDGKPVSQFTNINEALQQVTSDIRNVAQLVSARNRTPGVALNTEKAQQPAPGLTPKAATPQSSGVREVRRTLSAYMRAIDSIASEVELVANDAALDGLKREFQELRKPAFQAVLHDAAFLPRSRGHRLIGPHPALSIARPIAWSEKRFDLWQRVAATVLHLQDFILECDVLLSRDAASEDEVALVRREKFDALLVAAASRRLSSATEHEQRFLELFTSDVVHFDPANSETWLSNDAYSAGQRLVQDRAVRVRRLSDVAEEYSLEPTVVGAWSMRQGVLGIRRTVVELSLNAVWGTGASGSG